MWSSTDLNVRLFSIEGPSPGQEINSVVFELKVQFNFAVLENRINGVSRVSWGVSELWGVPIAVLFFVDDNSIAPFDSSEAKDEINITGLGAALQPDANFLANIAFSDVDEAFLAGSDDLVFNGNVVGCSMLRFVVVLWVI